MSQRFVLVILLFGLFPGLMALHPVQASADEDAIIDAQVNLYWSWKNERELVETDCSGWRTSMGGSRYAQAAPYVECSMNHFRVMAINWGAENFRIIELALERTRDQHLAMIPDDEMTDQHFEALTRGAAYTHQQLVAWYQRFGTMVDSLLACGFLSQPIAREMVADINAGLSTSTADARAYVERIKNDPELTRETIRTITRELHEKFSAPAREMVNRLRQALLSEKDRVVRYYVRELERQQMMYEETMKMYITMFDGLFNTFQLQGGSAWIELDPADIEARRRDD
jgi:hypothetical protein